ncbi:MAG: CinA family protein [Nitrospirota bacterium]|nr:CinA family protein [Nitrospirota bacterium]
MTDIVNRVHEIFRDRGMTLSVAESCTGGLISHYITSLPGASDIFTAGVVVYTQEAKKNILGVSPDIIATYGVVSEQTAREMAEKVRSASRSDASVSTTGNIGPGALEGKELGLVYIAASMDGKTISETLHLHGDREHNKEQATVSALRLLIELMEGGK